MRDTAGLSPVADTPPPGESRSSAKRRTRTIWWQCGNPYVDQTIVACMYQVAQAARGSDQFLRIFSPLRLISRLQGVEHAAARWPSQMPNQPPCAQPSERHLNAVEENVQLGRRLTDEHT